jgi:hypothetical protein
MLAKCFALASFLFVWVGTSSNFDLTVRDHPVSINSASSLLLISKHKHKIVTTLPTPIIYYHLIDTN